MGMEMVGLDGIMSIGADCRHPKFPETWQGLGK
jgi:hypothetical protein